MNPLKLHPLPSERIEDDSASFQLERDGFVDESAIMALLRGPQSTRSLPNHEDLILAVDDMDFAGWQISSSTPFRGSEIPPHVIDAIVRRASPPEIEEPGIGQPHRGSHRWWLAGLAGVFSTVLFSILLVSLSARVNMELNPSDAPQNLVRAKAKISETAEKTAPSPELTVSSAPLN